MRRKKKSGARIYGKSYGTLENKLPSPFGDDRSPSRIFNDVANDSSHASSSESPTPSSDDPWGPDSPDECLEPDSVNCVPRWPFFKDDAGLIIRCGTAKYRTRVDEE